MLDVREVYPRMPVLETERLLLRHLRIDDAADMFGYASDPEVARYTLWEAHATIANSESFVRMMLESYDDPGLDSWTWGLELRELRRLIGTFAFFWNPTHARAEIGYAIGREYWGRGLVTEAARAVIRLAFEELGFHRVEARCAPANVGSARVMEKCGMLYEGTLRGQMFAKGRFWDMKMYAILRTDSGLAMDEA